MFKLFKGLSLCLIFVIINLITVKVNAADAYFVWEKTTIDVPVYEDLEEYKDDYIVKLYVNGVLSNDFYVEMEVNCTTFSTVLTHIVGKYTVYYKAYSKNNYLSDEVAIVFNVVDITAPTLNLYSDIVEVNYGLSLKDINWYSVYDDTCSIDDIKIDIDDKNVIYNITGTYSAMIVATDIYGNSSKESFIVKVIDEIKPSILVLKPLVFNYGEDVVISDYFMCNDNYNNDITHRLKLYNLDTKKLGNQEITLKAKDYSNNETIVILDVVVVDLIPPILVLSYQEVMLDIYNYNEYNVDFFNNYIFSLTDNYSKPVNIILTIDCSLLQEEVAV